jgi:hypothetical protein
MLELDNIYLDRIVKCLNYLVRLDKEGWDLIAFENEKYKLLQRAMKSGNDNTKKEAEKCINYLLSKGRWKFKDILTTQ